MKSRLSLYVVYRVTQKPVLRDFYFWIVAKIIAKAPSAVKVDYKFFGGKV